MSASFRASANLLFASLPEFARHTLAEASWTTSHAAGAGLFRVGDAITEFGFPLSGLVSLTINTAEGEAVEIALVGVEGMVGVGRYLGASVADTNAVVQVAGDVMYVPVETVVDDARVVAALRPSVDILVRSLMVEMAQSALCNQTHSVEQRTARWLLHACDRAGTTDLQLTHEFLAQMLAVRRASVTDVVGTFSRSGMIVTSRGAISIADRAGLLALACECYGVVLAASPRYD